MEYPKPETIGHDQRTRAQRVSEVIHALTDQMHYERPLPVREEPEVEQLHFILNADGYKRLNRPDDVT